MRKRSTLYKYQKATIIEIKTVRLGNNWVIRDFEMYLSKYHLGTGNLERLRESKHELNASRSKRTFVLKLERRDKKHKKMYKVTKVKE